VHPAFSQVLPQRALARKKIRMGAPMRMLDTVFLHSCRFRSCPGGDSNERGRPASTVQSTAIVAPDHRLLHEKCGLRSGCTIAIEGGQHWRKTVVLLTSKKWRLQREGRQNRRHSIEMKSDWLFDKPRSYYWLRVAASNLAS